MLDEQADAFTAPGMPRPSVLTVVSVPRPKGTQKVHHMLVILKRNNKYLLCCLNMISV